ncbi:MAG: hypothetical protein ACRC17_00580 [Culicoidibacterales bacterium]
MKKYSEDVLKQAIRSLLVVEGKYNNQDLFSEKTGQKMRISEVEQEFEKIIQEVVERNEI